jgi:DNA-binding NarL/FixJ family response regulator
MDVDTDVSAPEVSLVCAPELLRLGLERLLAPSAGIAVTAHRELPSLPQPADVAVLCERGLGDLAASCATALDLAGREIVVVLAEADVHVLLDCVAAGALGVVLESDAAEDLVAAVHAAAAGRCFVAQPLLGVLFAHHRAHRPTRSESDRMLLHLLAGGRSTEEIASLLGIAPKTLRNRSSQLYRDLGVHSRRGAIAAAERRGLLD